MDEISQRSLSEVKIEISGEKLTWDEEGRVMVEGELRARVHRRGERRPFFRFLFLRVKRKINPVKDQ